MFWPSIQIIPLNFQNSSRWEYFYSRWSTYILGNASAKDRNPGGKSFHPTLVSNRSINRVNDLLIVRSRSCVRHGMLCHKGVSSWEEYGPGIYGGKHEQKCKKDEKKRRWHTNWLDWHAVSKCVKYLTWL